MPRNRTRHGVVQFNAMGFPVTGRPADGWVAQHSVTEDDIATDIRLRRSRFADLSSPDSVSRGLHPPTCRSCNRICWPSHNARSLQRHSGRSSAPRHGRVRRPGPPSVPKSAPQAVASRARRQGAHADIVGSHVIVISQPEVVTPLSPRRWIQCVSRAPGRHLASPNGVPRGQLLVPSGRAIAEITQRLQDCS